MNCNNTNTYNFRTRSGHKVWKKTVDYPLATTGGKFVMKIKNASGVTVDELSETNGRLVRSSKTLVEVKEHKETKTAGTYSYNLCFIEGDMETFLVRGKLS